MTDKAIQSASKRVRKASPVKAPRKVVHVDTGDQPVTKAQLEQIIKAISSAPATTSVGDTDSETKSRVTAKAYVEVEPVSLIGGAIQRLRDATSEAEEQLLKLESRISAVLSNNMLEGDTKDASPCDPTTSHLYDDLERVTYRLKALTERMVFTGSRIEL